MSNVIVGSISSQFPDDLPEFDEQDETLDSVDGDPTLAEAKDANKWSAEIMAICQTIGAGGRGNVTMTDGAATVEKIIYVYHCEKITYNGTISLAATIGAKNYIYLDVSDNTAKISTVAFPNTPHIPLAIWDDSGSGVSGITDARPHDLGVVREPITVAGTVTIAQGATTAIIAFPFAFLSSPLLCLAHQKPSDGSLRKLGFSSLDQTGAVAEIDAAAPVGGVIIHWLATGTKG